jgi:hypothetical protein
MESKDQPKNKAIGRTGLITFRAGISGLQSAGGWDEVVRLLAQYPETEERMKQLRLGK